jgi:ribosomal protein L37AE/L43A
MDGGSRVCVASLRAPAPLAQVAERGNEATMPIKSAKTRWDDVVLVCRKCQKKLDGKGYGPDGDKSLKKALRKYLKAGKGRKAELGVIETPCFDVCPKNAVVAVNAARPKELLIIPVGADLLEVRPRLGLQSDRPRPRVLTVVGEEAG